jgi:large repetitive protein
MIAALLMVLLAQSPVPQPRQSWVVGKTWHPVYVMQYPGTSATVGPRFGLPISEGSDIDGDGKPDFAVSASYENTSTGAVYIYKGGSIPPSLMTTIIGTASSMLGSTLGLADFTGDGHADLVAYHKISSVGNVDFFSAKNVDGIWSISTTRDFYFHSTTGSLVYVVSIPDVNGDGMAEIAMAEPTAASGLGKVYVFFGRSDWSSLISGGVVDVAQADVIVTGSDTNGHIGGNLSFCGLIDPTDATKGALVVPADSLARVYLFKASLLTSSSTITTSNALGPFYVTPAGNPSVSATFDANGDGFPDLIIGYGLKNNVYSFPQYPAGVFTFDPGMSPILSDHQNFGSKMKSGILQKGRPQSLVIGSNVSNEQGKVTITYPVSSSYAAQIRYSTNGGVTFGNIVSLVDVDGDGVLDVMVSAYGLADGSLGNGTVTIYRYY